MRIVSTRKISSLIEDTIQEARTFALLVSPYLKISDSLSERMLDRLNQNIRIVLIYGKVESNLNEYPELKTHKNISIYYLDNLHAKLYANDFGILLTSMNLHSYSEINNWELGAYFDYGSSEYEQLIKEVIFMLKTSKYKYGLNDYSIIKSDNEIEIFITKATSLTNNLLFEKIVLPSMNDEIIYSFSIRSKYSNNILMIFNWNFLSIQFKNDNEFALIKKLIINKQFSSSLRSYEKKMEISIYPYDGFNAKRENMSREEFQNEWIKIIKDIDSVLGKEAF